MNAPLTRRDSWASLALFVLGFALYAPSISHGFISYDDQRILLGQPALFAHQQLWPGVQAIFSLLPREEPLLVRDLSWLFDSLVFGFGNPLGAHLGNVLLHALICGLLMRVLRRLGFNLRVALTAALLFTLHPVHIEPVAWAMGRKDLLSTFFALLCLDAWMTAEDARGPRRIGAFALSLCFITLGMLSKINVLGLPLILAAASWLRGREGARRISKSTIAMLGAHFVVVLIAFSWYRATVTAYGLLGRGPPSSSPEHLRELTTLVPAQIVTYLEHLLIPWDYGLFYDAPAVGVAAPVWQIVSGWSLVLVAIAAAWLARRNLPQATFLLLGLGLTIAPYLNLVYIGIIVSNRYLYFPSLFAAGLVALGGVAAYDRRPVGRAFVLGVGAAWLLVAGVQQMRWLPAWADDDALSLYEVTRAQPSLQAYQLRTRELVRRAEKAPKGPQRDADLQLAMTLVQAGIAQYEALGVELVPGYYNYQQYYLARLQQWRGRILSAKGAPIAQVIAAYEEADTLSPGSRLIVFLLSEAYRVAALKQLPEHPETAREMAIRSLNLLDRYVAIRETGKDVARIEGALQRLGQGFPELGSQVEVVRTRLSGTPSKPKGSPSRRPGD